MNTGPEEPAGTTAETGRRPSWPYPVFLFLYVVIFLVTPAVGSTVGLALFCALMALCVWNAASRRQYEQSRKKYPDLSRSDYVMNNLVFPVIIPLVLFAGLVIFRVSASRG